MIRVVARRLRSRCANENAGRPDYQPHDRQERTDFANYRWRRDYGGLKLDQAKKFKDLERENERLKKAVSELTLDKLILKEALEGKY